jgi:RNA polymerase sigma factor (sigma-70 family)
MPDAVKATDRNGFTRSDDLETVLPAVADGLEIIAHKRLGSREDARDAVQETMVRLLERIRKKPPAIAEIGPVAYGILRHVIVDMQRAQARTVNLVGDAPDPAHDALDALITAEQLSRVRIALRSLAAEDQRLLRRCFVDGARIADIAAELGEAADRLRQRKSRALRRLAVMFRDRDSVSHPNDDTDKGP